MTEVFTELDERMPAGHVWKGRKLRRCMQCSAEIARMAPALGLRSSFAVKIVAFPCAFHDIGRLDRALRFSKGDPEPWRHGLDGALIVAWELFGGSHYRKPKLWRSILDAIKWHSLLENPTIEQVGSEATCALTSLVRDMDRVSGYEDALRYTGEAEFKERQRRANFARQMESDPSFGAEKRRILPERHLDAFLAYGFIPRDECASYEAYMLQYLSWIYQLTNPEIADLAAASGGPKIVLKYLLEQLADESEDQRKRLLDWAASWRDGILFHV